MSTRFILVNVIVSCVISAYCCVFLHSAMTATNPETRFSFKAPGGFNWISVCDAGVIWCGKADNKDEVSRFLYWYRFTDATITEIAHADANWQLMPAYCRGDWVVWFEYQDCEPPFSWKLKARLLKGGEVKLIAEGKAFPPTAPSFALDNGKLVYTQAVDETLTARSKVIVVELATQKVLSTLESKDWTYATPTLSGSTVICCRIAAQQALGDESDLFLYHLSDKEPEKEGIAITSDHHAYQPCLNGDRLVWKGGESRFAYGPTLLAHIQDKKLLNPQKLDDRTDMPVIGARYISWRRDGNDKISALQNNTGVVLDTGIVGKVDTSEDAIAWGSMNAEATEFEIRGIKP